VDPGIYYSIVNSFGAEMYLVGSETARQGIKMFKKHVSPEEPSDFHIDPKSKNENSPVWVFPDSTGKLEGLLHIYRRYEHCRDVVVLVTVETPESYIKYLEERSYNYYRCGEVKVDFKVALSKISEDFSWETMITDNGGILSSILLENGLVDQVSLIISPTLTGKKQPKLFRELKLGKRVIKLKPVKAEIMESKDVLMLFDVMK
jgi:2,5-diamino-6-(ribosylamino)-4(3H)-pyrimidinone 5'-phosphate reductase